MPDTARSVARDAANQARCQAPGDLHELVGERSSHQRGDGVARVAPFVQHLLQLLDDRHRDADARRDAVHGERAVVAFDDLADRAQRVRDARSAR